MHVELKAEDLRTRVRFPPPPPINFLIYKSFNGSFWFAGSQRVYLMFSKNTLFILGAGASLPYGYPTGLNLVKEIINNIDKDEIFFPLRQSEPFANFNLEKFTNNLVSCPNIQNIPDNVRVNNNFKLNAVVTVDMIQVDNNGFFFLKTPLNDLLELKELKEALIQFSPISIDTFLRDNPKYGVAGKIMIIYTLLKLENLNDFKPSSANKSNQLDDNWYPYLLNDILYGCAENPDNILNSNLNIITFNYDMSLDHYLIDTLSKIEVLVSKFPDKEYLDNIKIHHVYGSLYSRNALEYGKYYYKNPSSNRELNNTKRFEAANSWQNNILTMYEDRASLNSIEQEVEDAKEIIIIGFGFDRSNLDVLGFPTSITSDKNYRQFFSGKTIKYLNYDRQMTNIDNEFEIISNEINTDASTNPTKIIRSHAKKVTDAYFRDFKPSLLLD
ncbi:TPA: hypothetical protein I8685_001266 [Legionella pneumophila]|nr:hypothetical protein [Legionella pneumophila]HAT3883279.1 hypothetical protein [Legionella pneumophila]HAT4007498.1 hypothetical protein [Legionella pneumophila]